MQFILLFCRFSLRRMCVECELVDGVLFYSFILPLSLSFSESALLLLVQPIITLLCPTWNSVCFFFRLSLTNFPAFPPSTSSFRRDQPVNVFFSLTCKAENMVHANVHTHFPSHSHTAHINSIEFCTQRHVKWDFKIFADYQVKRFQIWLKKKNHQTTKDRDRKYWGL